MLNGKRIIALCLSRVNDYECSSLIRGVSEKLWEQNCKLFVYFTCSDFFWADDSEIGQTSIFNLMDYSIIDAVLIFDEKIKRDEIREKIERRAVEHNVPCIHIRPLSAGINVCFDFEAGFEQVARHVIEHHGAKKIHFMAGFEGNPISDSRCEVTKRVMAENGLELTDDCISYGNFWSGPTEEAAQKIIDSGDLPDAVICANDVMAISVCNLFKKNGIRVPEDVIITGFDGIDEIRFSVPGITSAVCSFENLGEKIACIIPDVIEGKITSGNFTVVPTLIRSGSCGCPQGDTINVSEHLTTMNNTLYVFQENEHKLFESSAKIQMAETLEEASRAVNSEINYNSFVFLTEECIDETISPYVNTSADSFGDKVCLFYDASAPYSKEPVVVPRMMSTKDIVPDVNWHLQDKYPLMFAAINLLNSPLGYVCFHYFSTDASDYIKIPQRIDSLNSAIGGLRNIRHQRYLTSQIAQMYKTDGLTRLYNRNAFNKEYEKLIKSLRYGERITVVLADLDGLKGINDRFGHGEGDNAISTVAAALTEIFGENALCCRFGGDEMIAVTKLKYDEEQVKAQFEKYFEDYNSTSNKPYEVAASVGVYTVDKNSSLDFEDLFKQADKKMYAEKVKRKAKKQAQSLSVNGNTSQIKRKDTPPPLSSI